MGRPNLAATVALVCATCLPAGAQTEPAGRQTPAHRASQQPGQTEMEKAVEEFKILTRELGLRADSPNKKGQNAGVKAAWHGRVFENFRNDFLDAVPHEVIQRGATKSMLRRNQFGFNVAGPVVLPKLYDGRRTTFFSLSYEGVRENIARSYLRTVPTMAERIGDFSSTVDSAGNPLPIYDPLTTRPNPKFDPSQPVTTDNLQYDRELFPGNRVPQSRLDPVARKALTYYPAPNTDVGPFFQNNFFIHAPEGNSANGMLGKLDHNVSERNRVSVGLSYSNGLLAAAKWFPNAASPGASDRNFHSRHGSLEYVFTASPRTVNTFTFEASTDGSMSGLGDETDYPAELGLSGSPGKEFPFFYLGSYLSIGRQSPISNNVRNAFTWTDAFSTRRGKHNFRVTGQWLSYQVNSFWPGSPAGSLYFSSGLTSLPGIIDTGHEFASFLLGMSEYANISMVGSPSYFRYGGSNVTLRHSYEAAPGLTFGFGLTIHTSRPRVEKYDRQSNVDLNAINPENGLPGALVFADLNGYPDRLQPIRTKLEPSASVAWNPGGGTKTVLRASFWRSYSGLPVYFGQFGTQGFNGTPTFISSNVQLEPAVTLARGFPALTQPMPDLRGDAANDTVADLAATDPQHQPMYQTAQLTLERELPGSMMVTLGASYAGAKDQYVGENVANPNAIPLSDLQYRDQLNDETFNASVRPYPQYKGFSLGGLYPYGKYQRDAAFLRVEKRASQGLTLSAYFEFAKGLDDYSGPYGTQDFYNRGNEWALNPWDSPERLSLSYNYDLPLGSNKALLAFNDWRRYLVDGWSVSGMTSFSSGYPLALHPEFNNTGGVVTALNVNVVPGVDPHVANPGPDLWFNPAAFDQPADFTIGNSSRTSPTLRGPISQNHDVSLTKRFALAADRAVEFSAVGMNFLNHANWSSPDTMIGPASAPNLNAGKIIGSHGGRVVQLGLRFSF
jgi:hypothetical protein